MNITSYRRTGLVERSSTSGIGGSTVVITDALGPPNNFDAVDDPTVDDDEDVWEVGSIWINNATGEVFILVDATDGAAVWVSLAAGASGDFLEALNGGGDIVDAHGSMGAGCTPVMSLNQPHWNRATTTP